MQNIIFRLLYPIYTRLHPQAETAVECALRGAGFAGVPARDVFWNLFANALFSIQFLRRKRNAVQSVALENPEILQHELDLGRPVVALSIHLGAFEILHRSLEGFGVPVHLLASDLNLSEKTHHKLRNLIYKLMNKKVKKWRGSPSVQVHAPTDAMSALSCMLAHRGILALMMDQSKDPKGTPAQLFGKERKLFLRLPIVANQKGASIVAFFTRPANLANPAEGHVVRFCKSFAPGTPPEILVPELARLMEEWIAEAPAHFAWNYGN
jgi:KDO2-lipid IV(A) lauroyltransferase